MFFGPERSGPKNKIKYGQSVYFFATARTGAKLWLYICKCIYICNR